MGVNQNIVCIRSDFNEFTLTDEPGFSRLDLLPGHHLCTLGDRLLVLSRVSTPTGGRDLKSDRGLKKECEGRRDD